MFKSLLLRSNYDRFGLFYQDKKTNNLRTLSKVTTENTDAYQEFFGKYKRGLFPSGFGVSLITPDKKTVAIVVDIDCHSPTPESIANSKTRLNKLCDFLTKKGIKHGVFSVEKRHGFHVWIGFKEPQLVNYPSQQYAGIDEVYPCLDMSGRSARFIRLIGKYKDGVLPSTIMIGDGTFAPINLNIRVIDNIYSSLENDIDGLIFRESLERFLVNGTDTRERREERGNALSQALSTPLPSLLIPSSSCPQRTTSAISMSNGIPSSPLPQSHLVENADVRKLLNTVHKYRLAGRLVAPRQCLARFELEHCPFESAHTAPSKAGESSIFIASNHKTCFQCFHHSCIGKKMEDVCNLLQSPDDFFSEKGRLRVGQLIEEIVNKMAEYYKFIDGILYHSIGVYWEKKNVDGELEKVIRYILKGRAITALVGQTYKDVKEAVLRLLVQKSDGIEFNKIRDGLTLPYGTNQFDYVNNRLITVKKNDYLLAPSLPCPAENYNTLQTLLDNLNFRDDAGLKLFQRYLGYCLIQNNRVQSCLFLRGNGSDGKTFLLDVVRSLFNDCELCTELSLARMAESRFESTTMENSIVAIVAENGQYEIRDSADFKRLLGDRLMRIEKKGGAVKYKNKFIRLIVSSNFPLRTIDCTDSMFRRFVVIPLDRIDDSKRIDYWPILQRIRGEIMRFALEGLCELYSSGFDIYAGLFNGRYLDSDFAENQPLLQFLQDCNYVKTVSSDDTVYFYELYQDYENWCGNVNKELPMSRTRFSRYLSDLGFPSKAFGNANKIKKCFLRKNI